MPHLKHLAQWLFSLFFIAAGLNHFHNPRFYVSIMPPAVPWPLAMVYVSGMAEVVLGIAVMIAPLQRLAAWGLILLLVAVFPANVYMAMHPEKFPAFSPMLLWARLPLQLVFLAWAYWFTKDNSRTGD